ncbi:kinesin-like protein KIF26B [Echeneis naucrates]|uniref:kinesin-like protein KIF26B n=1 Tax=Echeneis naucrates TaxID=173247 RepID=UPI001113C106|nr:kinesin-like protein KIF26B [Echeneis naucrates]
MCQRADAVPSYRSLPGSVGDRIRTNVFGTICRGSVAANPGFGRSDGKVACCEKCSATLVALKKQALSLAVHHHFSSKDSGDLSAFLTDNLRVHSRSATESRDREREQGWCAACGTNLNELKQEAIHLALSRGQSLAKPPFEPGLSTNSLLGQSETKHVDRGPRDAAMAAHQPHSRTHSPHSPQSPRTPQRTPQTLRRRGPKLPNPNMDRWVEEQHQLVTSKFNTDDVTVYPFHKAADDATLACGGAGIVQTSSKIPNISRVVNIANTAAMSFLARAAEKLNLTSRKKGQASDPAPTHFSTCFREIIQKNPPPVPSCLLQAATRTKDSPNVGKVKVVLRVSPTLSGGQRQPPVLQVDPSKKRVTIMEPISSSQKPTALTCGRDGKNLLKTFNFDAAYPQESNQAEVCAGVLADVIRCVLSGSDGCVLGLGCAAVGSWSSMVGSDESIQKLGLIPCAISWLYSAIERRREKTWTDLSVSVSAIELCCGEEDTLRDLLGEVVPSLGNIQDSPRARIRLQEDPVYGIQLRNHNRVKAPTAERAASLLDAAITARRHNDFVTYLSHSSIMLFTLHIQPPRTESNTIGKGSRGPTKLTMIDVRSGMRGVSRNKPPHAELGPVVLSLLSGHKTTPNKGSKLTMLLRESLGHTNCHTAVIAEVADSLAHLQESLSTIQLASRIRRTQKRTKQSTSCSPCGRSLTREKRGPQSLSLRAFHSTDEVDVDIHPFRLRGELDEHSSSDQSCDTVIQIDSDGFVHSKAAPRLAQPEFVPIIPSLHPKNADLDDPEFTALLQELLRIPQLQGENKNQESVQGHSEVLKADMKPPERDCLKCETFAELQERLGCIDGSEMTMEALKCSTKGPSVKNVATKSQPQKETGKQADTKSSEAPQMLLSQGLGCSQASVGEKQTDGAFPGDSFQREDSGLYDCEECSATSSSEELLNQTLSLSRTSRSELHSTATLMSGVKLPSQDYDAAAQSTAVTDSREVQSSGKQGGPEFADWFKSDKRTSPVGKSSPISPSSSCSSSQSLATSVIRGDILPNGPTEDTKEMKATITVTVQQPLDLKGQDELVFSMVEEVTISGGLDRGRTGSLPRGWQSANHQDSYHGAHMVDAHRPPREMTSSTPCSPGVTLERRHGRQHSPGNHSRKVSSPRKYVTEHKQKDSVAPRKDVGSLFEASGLRMKHDDMCERMMLPYEDSGKLFNTKLEQLASRTNSLGRTPNNFPTLERGGSTTSMSSKGSSKGSVEGACRGGYKGNNEGHCTLPRASRSLRKNPQPDNSPHLFSSENPVTQSAKHTHYKLSAVGKLKMAAPKVRRLSAPSVKNLSLSHKSLRQSINRSASLSPDSKTVSFERTSSFLSSSPPRSLHSISRTPSQSSTCSSTKSVIQGFVNGRLSDLLKERASSPTSGGVHHFPALPSPYSQVTAPRTPDHLSGHASDTTSVLSGDLPPAMGKTSLYFSNRNSMVSSGYDSMVRDSEPTGSSTSNRDSVSDRSASVLSVARSCRSSRRKGSTGTQQRRLSHDTAPSLRRSASGLRSRWLDRGIPEAYEIKVYEIDNVQRMQKRAGAGKQGPARFSAKLKFLEHRQQRISEVRGKYNNLRRELEQAKHNLMLEPAKWNQEFDLWQTFEVDSLEHLEALEVVTARLENRVNRCKANVMMVTCFDVATRRRQKKRRRKAPERRAFKGIRGQT